jgi:hypothetical protein
MWIGKNLLKFYNGEWHTWLFMCLKLWQIVMTNCKWMLGFGKVINCKVEKKSNTNQSMPNYHVKYFDFFYWYLSIEKDLVAPSSLIHAFYIVLRMIENHSCV